MRRGRSRPTQGKPITLPPQASAELPTLGKAAAFRDRKRRQVPPVVAALPGLLAVAMILLATPRAFAQWTPLEAALEWQDPEIARLRGRLAVLEAELHPWGAFDYSARLRPLLRYRDYPGDGKDGDLSARISVSGSLDFTDPPATRARTMKSREQLRRKMFLLRTRGVRDALLAHAAFLIASEEEARAKIRLQPFEGDADEGSSHLAPERRRASLDHRRAERALELARVEAAAFGIASPAPYRSLRFVLPTFPSRVHDDASSAVASAADRPSHERRMLELALLEAEAELREEQARVVDDLRVGAAYRSRGLEVEVEGGIVNGGPGAAFRVDFPGGRERWELTIHAELVLDDSAARLAELEEAVRLARGDLALFAAEHAIALADAHASASLAEEGLALAEEQTAVAEIAGNVRAASSARLRMYRAWIDYLRRVQELLELTDESWQLRSD